MPAPSSHARSVSQAHTHVVAVLDLAALQPLSVQLPRIEHALTTLLAHTPHTTKFLYHLADSRVSAPPRPSFPLPRLTGAKSFAALRAQAESASAQAASVPSAPKMSVSAARLLNKSRALKCPLVNLAAVAEGLADELCEPSVDSLFSDTSSSSTSTRSSVALLIFAKSPSAEAELASFASFLSPQQKPDMEPRRFLSRARRATTILWLDVAPKSAPLPKFSEWLAAQRVAQLPLASLTPDRRILPASLATTAALAPPRQHDSGVEKTADVMLPDPLGGAKPSLYLRGRLFELTEMQTDGKAAAANKCSSLTSSTTSVSTVAILVRGFRRGCVEKAIRKGALKVLPGPMAMRPEPCGPAARDWAGAFASLMFLLSRKKWHVSADMVELGPSPGSVRIQSVLISCATPNLAFVRRVSESTSSNLPLWAESSLSAKMCDVTPEKSKVPKVDPGRKVGSLPADKLSFRLGDVLSPVSAASCDPDAQRGRTSTDALARSLEFFDEKNTHNTFKPSPETARQLNEDTLQTDESSLSKPRKETPRRTLAEDLRQCESIANSDGSEESNRERLSHMLMYNSSIGSDEERPTTITPPKSPQEAKHVGGSSTVPTPTKLSLGPPLPLPDCAVLSSPTEANQPALEEPEELCDKAVSLFHQECPQVSPPRSLHLHDDNTLQCLLDQACGSQSKDDDVVDDHSAGNSSDRMVPYDAYADADVPSVPSTPQQIGSQQHESCQPGHSADAIDMATDSGNVRIQNLPKLSPIKAKMSASKKRPARDGTNSPPRDNDSPGQETSPPTSQLVLRFSMEVGKAAVREEGAHIDGINLTENRRVSDESNHERREFAPPKTLTPETELLLASMKKLRLTRHNCKNISYFNPLIKEFMGQLGIVVDYFVEAHRSHAGLLKFALSRTMEVDHIVGALQQSNKEMRDKTVDGCHRWESAFWREIMGAYEQVFWHIASAFCLWQKGSSTRRYKRYLKKTSSIISALRMIGMFSQSTSMTQTLNRTFQILFATVLPGFVFSEKPQDWLEELCAEFDMTLGAKVEDDPDENVPPNENEEKTNVHAAELSKKRRRRESDTARKRTKRSAPKSIKEAAALSRSKQLPRSVNVRNHLTNSGTGLLTKSLHLALSGPKAPKRKASREERRPKKRARAPEVVPISDARASAPDVMEESDGNLARLVLQQQEHADACLFEPLAPADSDDEDGDDEVDVIGPAQNTSRMDIGFLTTFADGFSGATPPQQNKYPEADTRNETHNADQEVEDDVVPATPPAQVPRTPGVVAPSNPTPRNPMQSINDVQLERRALPPAILRRTPTSSTRTDVEVEPEAHILPSPPMRTRPRPRMRQMRVKSSTSTMDWFSTTQSLGRTRIKDPEVTQTEQAIPETPESVGCKRGIDEEEASQGLMSLANVTATDAWHADQVERAP